MNRPYRCAATTGLKRNAADGLFARPSIVCHKNEEEGLEIMNVTRRNFLKFSGLSAGSVLLPAGAAVSAEKIRGFPLHKPIKESATICPYCSCGCGLLIATGPDGHIINAEGDPDNPQNRGALDPKSISVRQLSQSPLRLEEASLPGPGERYLRGKGLELDDHGSGQAD